MKEMGLYDIRPCPCGSGKPSAWLYDARSIAVARICEDCEAVKMKKYRPDIFKNANYDLGDDKL